MGFWWGPCLEREGRVEVGTSSQAEIGCFDECVW